MSIKNTNLGKVSLNLKILSVVGKTGFNAKLAIEGIEPILAKHGYQILGSETRAKGSGSPLATRLRLRNC
ncbi:MAG: hypothetical protein IMZ61_07820 [Planctomycetes bacterium]|nr:hypothetical protein [Planctomycetota bacterium]